MLTRRSVLILGAAAPLAGCQFFKGQTPAQVTVDIANELTMLGNEFVAAIPPLSAAGVLSASAMATITSDVSLFDTTAKQVTTTLTANMALPTVQQLEGDFNGMVVVASGLAPPPFGTCLAVAAVLLPFIENELNALIAGTQPPSPTVPPAPASVKMRALLPVRGAPLIL